MLKNKVIAVLVFFSSFIVYLLTLCKNITWGDPPFMSACSYLLGLPHPPSFPIYVIWGRIFSLIPINNPAWCTNMMSALWGSLGLVLLYCLIIELFDCFKNGNKEINKLSNVPSYNLISNVSAISGVFGLGFTSAFWFQALRAEVYTLNFFFFVLVLYLVVKWYSSLNFKIMSLACFVYGLSFANHSFLMVTLFPAFLIFVIVTSHREIFVLKRMGFLFGLFLFAISVYLFVLIRANQWPAINSGAPDSWHGLFNSITRSSDLGDLVQPKAYENRLWFCLSFPVYQFSLIFFGWGILGMVRFLKTNWRLGTLFILIFFLNILTATWAANFSLSNKDILGYLLPSLSVFAICISLGFYYTSLWFIHVLRNRSDRLISWLTGVFVIIFFSFMVFQLFRNVKECDQSKNVYAYKYGKEVLSSLKQNALILPISDYTLNTFWYLVYAEKIRPDVKIIAIGMKRHRAYIRQLRRQYPEVKFPANSEEVKTLTELKQFLSELCRLNVGQMPIYYDYYYGDKPFLRHLWPHGFVFEYKADEIEIPDSTATDQYNYFQNYLEVNKVYGAEKETQLFFGTFLYNMGAFYGKIDRKQYVDRYVRSSFNTCADASLYRTLGKSLMSEKRLSEALILLQAAVRSDPYDEENYYSLAHCYYEIGDYTKSEEVLLKAKQINPHSTSIRKRLKELEVLKKERTK